MALALLLSIALGIGCDSAVYGFLQGLIHPASPLQGPGRMVSVFGEDRFRNAGPLSSDQYQGLIRRREIFEWVGAARIAPQSIVVDGRSEIATVAAVTPDVAEALRLPLKGGVVISHRMWVSEPSARVSAIGSRIQISRKDFQIGGVAPGNLDGLYSDQSVDVWVRASEEDLEGGGHERRDLWVIARLSKEVSPGQAQTALERGLSGRLVSVIPFTGVAPNMARGLSRVGFFLTFSAGAVFFIACINVASLLFGRALRRSHETCLRIALGATRAELLWELFADSLVIAAVGGAAGLLVGVLTARALPAFLFEGDAERLSFAPHLLPIVAAALMCICVTKICGMLPVVGTVTDRPWMVLQRESGSTSKVTTRLRSTLVVAQIAVCCMLVICAAVLLAGMRSEMKTEAGTKLGNPILMTIQAQPLGGPEVDSGYFNELERKAGSIAGLVPLAWTARIPGNRPTWRDFEIQQWSTTYRDFRMDISWIAPEAIQSLQTTAIAGRMFGINDQKYRVAVVNEEAAAELFGRGTAGMVIRDPDNQPLEIVGVVKEAGNEVVGQGSSRKRRPPTIYYGIAKGDGSKSIKGAPFRVPTLSPEADVELNVNIVSENYFSALDMSLIAGEKFFDDGGPVQGRVAIINQEAADLYFGGKPLGAGVIDESGERTEIIGVVRSQSFGRFEQHVEPTIYFPMWQDCPARMTLMMRSSKWNGDIESELKRKVESVPGRGTFPTTIKTLDEQLAQSGLAPLRIATLIGAASAGIGLMLSVFGLLSTQGDAEVQRQPDRALRMALGAQRWRIVMLVVQNALWLALLGAAIGVLSSFAEIRLLMADMGELKSPSIQIWFIAPLLPVAVVAMASLIPARSASRIAPGTIMRDR